MTGMMFHFPLQHGDLAGCHATLTFTVPAHIARQIEDLVAGGEQCEGRCGAQVAAADFSGDPVPFELPDPLDKLTLPTGLWEPAHDDVDAEGDPVRAVVFHDAERCRTLRTEQSTR